MNWNEKAEEATAGRGYEFSGEAWAFVEGAKWLLYYLRTDEAVERVADALFYELEGCTITQHEAECPRQNCGYRDEFTRRAKAVITALLGEDHRGPGSATGSTSTDTTHDH